MVKNYLRLQMAKKNYNSKKISSCTGISESTISKFLNDKTDVKLSTLIKICTFLDCNLSELVEFILSKK